jgi:hypothetical protein
MVIGAIGGSGFSNIVGGIGFVAPTIGLAYGIAAVLMRGIGAVLGLAAYGIYRQSVRWFGIYRNSHVSF